MAGFAKLHKAAIERCNESEVTELVHGGTSVNSTDSNGMTILHYAACYGNIEMIKHLHQLGADVHARDLLQSTPLHHAVSVLATDYMVKVGWDSSEGKGLTENERQVLINRSLELTKIKLVDCLLNLGADINATFDLSHHIDSPKLHNAIQSNNVQGAVRVLETNPTLANETKVTGYTALLQVIDQGQFMVMKHLVDRGADVNATYSKVPVLYAALQSGNVQMVKTLLEHGADIKCKQVDVECKKFSGFTPLTLAMRKREKEMMRYLVDRGADVNATRTKIPVLYAAVELGNMEILQTLLKVDEERKKKILASRKVMNITAVSEAITCRSSGLDMITCLADLHADLNIPTTYSHAVHEAVKIGKPNIIRCLVEHGINKKCQLSEETPIYHAFFHNKLEILKYLVQKGANINGKFKNGVDAIPFAVSRGDTQMVKLLAELGFKFDEMVLIGRETTLLRLIIGMSGLELPANPKVFLENTVRRVPEILLELGADVNATTDIFTEVEDAVNRGDIEMVKTLAKLGAHLNRRNGLKAHSLVDLFLAEKLNYKTEEDENILTVLLEHGAHVSSACQYMTPISLAIERSNVQMVKTLYMLGTDINGTISMESETPVLQACSSDRGDLLKLLIENGADIHAEYREGIEHLLHALERGDKDMVQCLLDCGAKRKVGTGYKRRNALNLAISESNVEAIKQLLAAGCRLNPNDRVEHGNLGPDLNQSTTQLAEEFQITISEEPLHSHTLIAEYLHHNPTLDMFQTLLSHGANKDCGQSFQRITLQTLEGNKTTKRSFSNLHSACMHGDLDIVRLLIIDGSNVNEPDSDGYLPLQYLNLASSVAYDTLKETTTAVKVIEKADFDFEPILPLQNMEAILCTPGLGDVTCIEYPKSTDINEKVYQTVRNITNKQIICCGSSAEGTKVGLPDEMDFLVKEAEIGANQQTNLRDVGNDYVEYYDQSIVDLSLGSSIFHEQFQDKLFMNTRKHHDSDITIEKTTAKDLIRDTNRRATSALWMTYSEPNRLGESNVNISVDVVPSLHVANSWPKDGRKKTWLLGEVELKEHGYYLVPKPPHASSALAEQFRRKQRRTVYKISFPHLETYHMQHLEKRVKDVYVLAKCLRNPDVCRIMVTDQGSYPKNVDKYVTSYMLKMIFFKNVEDFLGSDLSLGEMVCRVYDGVEEGLSKGSIPSYFMPQINAFGGSKMDVKKCARVARIMQKFVHALYLRDCPGDQGLELSDDVEQAIVYQRTPSMVYRCTEIAEPEEMPETKMWDCE